MAYQEANAAALLGNASRARDALLLAQAAAETITPDSGISAWSFPTGRQALFTLAVATETGDADTALSAVATADSGWASGEPHVPANWAQIRVGAGIAHLMKGNLDAAVEEVTPMLTLSPERRVATVTAYAAKLARLLNRPPYQSDKIAQDFQQQIREFNTTALPEDNQLENR